VSSAKARQLKMDFDHQPVEWSTINALVDEMTEVYLRDDRPWVIGFSGGKDSSVVVQLAYRMLMALPPEKRFKTVHVVSSDTMVENPRVADWLDRCHEELRQAAAQYDLPIKTVKVFPDPSQSFWVCLIGKGYPAPTSDFRWCTGRLKIDPAESHVIQHIEPTGRILQLLGSRKSESKARKASIEAHALDGKFGTCGSLAEGISYQPIQDLDNDHVWELLRLYPKPWGPFELGENNNAELFDLYQDGHGGECVLEFDRRTASCGGSRFGCWTCTVVPEDTSMTNMVGFSNPEFAPLLAFRQKILDYRNDYTKRDTIGRNGRIRINSKALPVGDKGEALYGPWITPGPYLPEIRAELLRDLFEIEKALPGFRTVTDDDLHWIKHWWEFDGCDSGIVDRLASEYGREKSL
jgi:DNA sulfur modification protein DndC